VICLATVTWGAIVVVDREIMCHNCKQQESTLCSLSDLL